jgi:hypothetical protein
VKELDPRRSMICWHESHVGNHEGIFAQGFRTREERLYVALHPGWPMILGRKFAKRFTLYALEIPLVGPEAWTIGVDCIIGLWECHLRRAIPRERIVDHVDSDEPRAWPRFARGDGEARREPLPAEFPKLERYPGWIPDVDRFLGNCREAIAEHARDAAAAVLGALHLVHSNAGHAPTSDIPLLGDVLPRLLVEDHRLDPGTRRAAADVLMREEIVWLPLATRLAPPRTLLHAALLAAFAHGAPRHDRAAKDAFARMCASGLEERHARHLGVIHELLRGGRLASRDLADADAQTMEALVQVVRQVPLGTDGGRRALDAVAAMPEPLADLGLVELLRHRRSVPSRARRHLVQLLRSRVPRIRAALEEIAASMDGQPQKQALWLLGKGTLSSEKEDD